jgi:carboxypeptidase T
MDRFFTSTVLGLGLMVFMASSGAFAEVDHRTPGFPSHDYKAVQTFMQGLAQKYPANVMMFDLVVGDSGDKIQGLKIGNGPIHNLVVGTHHGNEYGATEVTKAFAESVAETPIDGQTLFVIPVLNVSGYDILRREETSSKGKVLDSNRDYPGPCGTSGSFVLKSTAALAQFLVDQDITASATLHTFGPAVTYPWGIPAPKQDLSTAYDDIFKAIADASVSTSNYPAGNTTELIYSAVGTFEDYAFWKLGVWSLLYELGDTHTPSESQVATLLQVNVPGLRNMMMKAPTVRAENHDFTGRCDGVHDFFDLHNE